MDQIKEFLTRKNIIVLLILAVLAAGLLVGVRLVQQQTQLKSKAAASPGGEIKFRGSVSGDSCIDPASTDPCVATGRNIQLEITNPFTSPAP